MRDPGGGQPSSLHAGDRVAVVAPSGPVDSDRLERGAAVLRSLGLEVTFGRHVLDVAPGLPHLAGTDADRAADLQAAWCDPEIAAVFCARGGYGAARVLDHLDWAALGRAAPKLLHGSSDITALHVAFGRRLGVATSFGPMVASLIADAEPEALDHLRAALFDRGAPVAGTHALRAGRATGTLTGGNLALLTSLLATPYAPEPATGRIAFLEDVGEAPYRVDRMLTQLRQAGWFDGVAGIVLGTWTGCGDLDAVFADRLGPLGVPILAGVPVGHGPRQLTIRLGASVMLDADALVLHPGVPDARGRRSGPPGAFAGETP
ncbi:S66 peptidase family protein [Actinoallomurus soli]|uniref:S66 peptidase family protein n=1 Tax=Actinoallomurus soli TaxID=2952535 RepID=UPI0020922C26|nr:LD-carboxypeptidase [Actinoallomurus soli]MCO5974296.1 LD-carboxypeptidase [Actinoallomurus soli]